MLLDHYPYTLKVDDLEIRLKLARFTVDQHAEFTRLHERSERSSLRVIKLVERLATKDAEGHQIETPTELRLRLEDERPEDAKKYEAALGELDRAHLDFMTHVFTCRVLVEAGQFPDQSDDVDGGILLRYWGARPSVLSNVAGALLISNTLGPKGLERFASLSASGPFSIAPSLIPDGAAPAPIAEPADANSSASPEGATSTETATPAPELASSGATATSS